MIKNQTVYVLWEEQFTKDEFIVVGVDFPLQHLTVEKIGQLIHEGYWVWLVLPAKSCTIYQIDLPKLPAKDIPAAIESSIEDRLIQDFASLWWFYQKSDQDSFDVFVWDKAWLQSVREFWTAHDITFRGITVDWFALKPREIFIFNQGDALIRSDEHNGYLSYPLFLNWIKDKSFEANIYYSEFQFDFPGAQCVGSSWPEWMTQRFLVQPPVHIDKKPLQFELQNYLTREQIEMYFPKVIFSVLGFVALVFVVVFGKNTVMYFQNFKALHQFSNPKMGSLQRNLASYQRQQAQKKQFWSVWIALQKALPSYLNIQQIKYDQNKMQLNFEMHNVSELQQMKNKLIRQNIKIIQSQVQLLPNGIRVVLQLQGRT